MKELDWKLEEFEPCEVKLMHMIGMSDPQQNIFVTAVCSRGYCPRCVVVRNWRIGREVRRHLEYHRPRYSFFMTLSVRNDFTIQAAWNQFQWTWKRFLDSARWGSRPWEKVKNWIGVREITYSVATGFNLHQHLIADSSTRTLPYKDLHQMWDEAAQYKAHFHISQVKGSPLKVVNYLAKYMSKRNNPKPYWGGLTQLQCYRLHRFLKGKNRISRSRGSRPVNKKPEWLLCCETPDHTCQRF